jgi:phage terminase large subunit-like protein
MVPTGSKIVERTNQHGIVTAVKAPTFDAWIEAWTPGETLAARAAQDQAPYEVWVSQGWLNSTPGALVRYDILAARVAEAATEYQVQALAYDSYAFHKHFVPELDALGCTVPVVEHPQGGKRRAKESGLWMPGSLKSLEALILEKRVRILRSPVAISAIMSATIESDAFGNGWFSKRKATNRIDGVVALAQATGAATGEIADPASVYEKKDLLLL